MADFFGSQADYIYFFYGLAFILMAQACFGLVRRDRDLPWLWLGLFGAAHGADEWTELVIHSLGLAGLVQKAAYFLMAASFLAAVEFGRAGTGRTTGRAVGRWVFLPLTALTALGALYGWAGLDVSSRYALGLVGTGWSAYALYTASKGRRGAARSYLAVAGAAMGLYSLFAGLVVPPAPFFPASLINTDTFSQTFGVSVKLLKGLAAAWAAIAVTLYSRAVYRAEAERSGVGLKPTSAFLPVAVVVCIAVLGWVFTDTVGRHDEEFSRKDMLARVLVASSAINHERVERLTGTSADSKSPDYIRLKDQLESICLANCRSEMECTSGLCRHTYIEGVRGGKIVLLVSASESGHAEEPAERDEEEIKEFHNPSPDIYGPYNSRGERWFRTAAPVMDPNSGRVIAQLVMEIKADDWARMTAVDRLFCIVITLSFCVIGIVSTMVLQQRRVSAGQGAELRLAEAKLANEKKLADITSTIGEGVYVLDGAGHLTFMNPEAERLLGWSGVELAGKDMHVAVHSRNADGSTKFRDKCPICGTLATGVTRRVHDDLFIRRDGSSFPVDYVATPIMEHGRVAGVVTAFQDITGRKKSEDALRLLKAAIESLPIGITISDVEGKIQYANPAEAATHGYTADELVEKDARIFSPPELWKPPSAEQLKEMEPWTREAVNVRKDGKAFPVQLTSTVLKDDKGNPLNIITACQDITERKWAEEAIRRSNDLLFSLNHIQSLFIEETDPHALFDDILGNLLALTRSEYGFIGEVIHGPDGSPSLRAHAVTGIAWDEDTRSSYERRASTEMELRNLDTLYGEVMAAGKPIISNDPAGDPRRGGLPEGHPPLDSYMGLPFYTGERLVGMVGVANRPGGYDEGMVDYLKPFLSACAGIVEAQRDEQMRKIAEDALRAGEERYRALFNSGNDAVFVHHPDEDGMPGRFLEVNDVACQLLGFSREEMLVLSPKDIVAPKYFPDIPSIMEKLYSEKKALFEHELMTRDGRWVPFELSAHLFDLDGQTTFLTVARDITERKRAEEKLREKDARYAEAEVVARLGHWDANVAGDRVFWSDGLCRLFGMEPAEFDGNPGTYMDFVHPDDKERVTRLIVDSLRDARPLIYDTRIVRKDGADRVIHVHGQVGVDAEGRAARILGTIQDITEQKQAEEGLRLMSEAIEEAHDGIQIVDLGGHIMYSNKAVEKIYGFTPDEFKGRHVGELNADPEYAGNVIIPAIRETGHWTGELTVKHKDGDVFPIWLTTALVKDEGGRPIASVGIIRDITELKRVEREKDRLLKGISESSEGIAFADEKGRYNYMNRSHAAMYGYEPEDLIGKTWRELVPPESLRQYEEAMTAALSNREAGEFKGEGPGLRKDGSIISVDALIMGMWDEDGDYLGHVCHVRDITEKKRIDEAIKESESKFRSLVEESLVGVYIIQDGRFVYVNPRICGMLGYTPEELLGGVEITEYVYPEDRATVRQNIMKRLNGGTKDVQYQPRWLRKDGGIVDAEIFGSSISIKGRPAIIGTMLDITERKNLERQRADFYAMVTHDLKSPLTAVLGYSDIIISDGPGKVNGETMEMVESIKRSSRKLLMMVEDFLTVSRMESGIVTLNESLVDMEGLVEEAAAEAAALARKKGLSFENRTAEGLGWLVVDRTHILRAVSNLVQNAVNYTPAGGGVTLKAERTKKGEGEFAVISVSDSGPGIPSDEHGKIFDKYYRSPGTAGIRGSGLGLAIVRAVAEAHGGKVEVESAEGLGSTFKLIIPA